MAGTLREVHAQKFWTPEESRLPQVDPAFEQTLAFSSPPVSLQKASSDPVPVTSPTSLMPWARRFWPSISPCAWNWSFFGLEPRRSTLILPNTQTSTWNKTASLCPLTISHFQLQRLQIFHVCSILPLRESNIALFVFSAGVYPLTMRDVDEGLRAPLQSKKSQFLSLKRGLQNCKSIMVQLTKVCSVRLFVTSHDFMFEVPKSAWLSWDDYYNKNAKYID